MEAEINSGFNRISDDELDDLVQKYHQENLAGGRGYIIGHLRATHSLRIQRQHVIDSINHIDRLGQEMWPHVGKKRPARTYTVPRPNALWHIDGHHKLIAWGIVIHGIADGYTRKVCKHCTDSNTTNLRLLRSQGFRQIRITDPKLSLTCLSMQS